MMSIVPVVASKVTVPDWEVKVPLFFQSPPTVTFLLACHAVKVAPASMVRVPSKVMEVLCNLNSTSVLEMVTLLKLCPALVPVIFLVTVPSKVTVPELWVKVPPAQVLQCPATVKRAPSGAVRVPAVMITLLSASIVPSVAVRVPPSTVSTPVTAKIELESISSVPPVTSTVELVVMLFPAASTVPV